MGLVNAKAISIIALLLLIIAGAVVGLRMHQVSGDQQAASMLSDPNNVKLDNGKRY